jgi:hypothetical protein
MAPAKMANAPPSPGGTGSGVISPPSGVDPGIRAPTPPAGSTATMPVIPPPGTPGGNPNVQAK